MSMSKTLHHRGPDSNGIYRGDTIGLAHTRLSIIDKETGQQPFVSEEGVVLIANGEIYNDLKLRKEFSNSLYKTNSDSESILQLYLKFGVNFINYLHGMYAVAVYDPRINTLILARDIFGIKPLYYTETRDAVWFASETQSLRVPQTLPARENKTAIDEFFALQYSCDRETAISGVHRVLPGETLVIRDGKVSNKYQQQLLPRPKRNKVTTQKDFEDLWIEALSNHTRSDGPYGMFLSGGVDSASILVGCDKINNVPKIAYTARFPDSSAMDECDQASALATYFGVEHCTVDVSESDFWNNLGPIVEAMDEPIADYAAVPTYIMAKTASRDVKVILTGEGGDEVFAGYGRYRAATRPLFLKKNMWSKNILGRVGVLRYPKNKWRDNLSNFERDLEVRDMSKLQKLQTVDINYWLPNNLLTKVDRCLMAHGVEGRVPFLDLNISRLGFFLDDSQKVSGRLGKFFLRQWLAKACPIAKPFERKQGFSVPILKWLLPKAPLLGHLVAKQPGVHQHCDPEAVKGLFRRANTRNAHAIWLLLFYALWHQHHIVGIESGGAVEDLLVRS